MARHPSYYKYYAGVTSQLGFCATPLRLDSYNKCQYACGYCFASTRQGYGRGSQLKISNPASLAKRLERVHRGTIQSALDEFIHARIPFQLGGMSDPFMELEKKKKTTLDYLRILKNYDYPVIISTKSNLIASDHYLSELVDSNVYVRFSVTCVREHLRSKIDKGCPSLYSICSAARLLYQHGVPVCFRLQPIIPGHEGVIFDLIDMAAANGVRHISAEFLKSPIDANKNFSAQMCDVLNGKPISFYREAGSRQIGREYVMPLSYRGPWLSMLARQARDRGITVGFADNDLLIHSDGDACCAASNLYLRNASFFTANIVSVAKNKKIGEEIRFRDLSEQWLPDYPISTYLNSKARIKLSSKNENEWKQYLREMWQGMLGVYAPDFFDGVVKTSEKDSNGLPVFLRKKSAFEADLVKS